MNPKVSVIVPVYNAENYLSVCIESLINQTLKEIEIILIDDGSTDNSGAICDEYADKDQRIVVVHQKNAGLGMVRNRGMDICTGKYFGFVDSDDSVETDFYQKLYDCTTGVAVDAVTGGMTDVYFDHKEVAHHPLQGRILNKYQIVNELLPSMLGYDKKASGYAGMSVCRGIFSKSIIDKTGIKFKSERELISEDAVFDLEYFNACNSVAVSDSVGYYYYHRNSGASLTTKYLEDRFQKYKILYKYEINLIKELKIDTSELISRIRSMFIANTRVLIMQEAANEHNILQKSRVIKSYLNDSDLQGVLNEYDFSQYALKLKVFTKCMKNKNATLALVLAMLQNNISRGKK